MANHQPLMPKIDKKEAKELSQPAPISPPVATQRKIRKKQEPTYPKIMYQKVSVSVSESISLKNI